MPRREKAERLELGPPDDAVSVEVGEEEAAQARDAGGERDLDEGLWTDHQGYFALLGRGDFVGSHRERVGAVRAADEDSSGRQPDLEIERFLAAGGVEPSDHAMAVEKGDEVALRFACD